jgi:hypothetical protein
MAFQPHNVEQWFPAEDDCLSGDIEQCFGCLSWVRGTAVIR